MVAFLPLACPDQQWSAWTCVLSSAAHFQVGIVHAMTRLPWSCVLWPMAGIWASRQSQDHLKFALLAAKIKIQLLRHGGFCEESMLPALQPDPTASILIADSSTIFILLVIFLLVGS